jgi:hypothetical protein
LGIAVARAQAIGFFSRSSAYCGSSILSKSPFRSPHRKEIVVHL